MCFLRSFLLSFCACFNHKYEALHSIDINESGFVAYPGKFSTYLNRIKNAFIKNEKKDKRDVAYFMINCSKNH